MASAREPPHQATKTPDSVSTHLNGFSFPQHGLSNNLFANLPMGWDEPPLRQPQPSFVDNKLERQGVLENMMPLGTVPSAKMKANARSDPLRRHIQSRGLEAQGADEARSTPEQSAVSEGTRAASLRADESSRPATPSSPPTRSLPTPDVASPTRQEPVLSPRPQAGNEARPAQSVLGGHITSQTRPNSYLHRTPTQTAPIIIGTPFAKAIMETRRRGADEQSEALRALHIATQQDRHLADLLTGEGNGNLTPELQKLLRKKIKLVKAEFHRRFDATPAASGSQTATTIGLLVNNSLAKTPNRPTDINTSRPNNASSTTPTAQSAASPLQKITSPTKSLALHQSPRRENSKGSQALPRSDPPTTTPTMASPRLETPSPSKKKSSNARRGSSSSARSDVGNEIVSDPPNAAAQDTNANGKRPAADLDPETEERRKRARSSLALPQDYAVGESNIRDQTDGKLAPSNAQPRGQTLHLNMTRSRASMAVDPLMPAVATASTPPVAEPGPTNLGRPPKRGAPAAATRVKVSPQKKGRSTVVAGIGRLDGKRPETPDFDGHPVLEESENNDFCSACSGTGFLLCCDGCERSFHFDCVDPPIDPETHLDEPWYCRRCDGRHLVSNGTPAVSYPNLPGGLFGALETQLVTRNTTAFVLPRPISSFFDGVKMGTDGEYQLVPPPMPKNWKRKTGYNDDGSKNGSLVQYFTEKGEVKPILCSACGLSAYGNREIIPCDSQDCQLHWHTDCMNPPLANAPRQKTPWKCPAHATHDIDSLDPLRLAKIREEGILPSHRIRKPRAPVTVDVPAGRSARNNGLIEVRDDGSPTNKRPKFKDENLNTLGETYSLPASGIIVDFISKAKSDKKIQDDQAAREQQRVDKYISHLKAIGQYEINRQLQHRSLLDRRTALSLLQFKTGHAEFQDLTDDGLKNLAYVLEAEAPDEIVSDAAYARTSHDNSIASERKQLELMQALIKHKLEALGA